MSSIKFYAQKRGSGLVPATAWAGEQFDQLPTGVPLLCTISSAYVSKRTVEQNQRLWASLAELSKQLIWHGQKLTPENWKDVMSASLKAQKVVPGIDAGSFVILGEKTSQMTVSQFSEMLELIYAFGAQHGVVFREPAEEMA